MKVRRILVVDEDPTVGEAISMSCASEDTTVFFAEDIEQAKHILAEQGDRLDLVITAVEPRGHALRLLKEIKATRLELPMVVLGSHDHLQANAAILQQSDCKLMNTPIDFSQLWRNLINVGGGSEVIELAAV